MTKTTRPPAGPQRRRRILQWSVLSLGALALSGAGWWGWQHLGGGKAPADKYLLATVQKGDVEDLVSATGALQPRDYVDVGAQVSGQLKKIHVEVGSVVREGDLLAEIDATQSTAKVEANRANLRAQEAQLVASQITLEKAERDAKRQRRLWAEEATTAETLQNADTAWRAAAADIEQTKAQIDQLRASMRVEEANLQFTKIYAPMDGTVVSISAKQGQTLNTNQQAPTLLRIANLQTMTVQTQVSEADVGKLRGGMQAYFTTLGSQGRRWWGGLRKVEPTPTVTNNVVLYNALFDVPNPNQQLMTQMTAQVFFVAAQAKDVLTVPMAALTLKRGGASNPSTEVTRNEDGRRQLRAESGPGAPGGVAPRARYAAHTAASGSQDGARTVGVSRRRATARVLLADGTVQEREVTIGVTDRITAQVLSGLNEGERVVVGTKGEDPGKRTSGTGGSGGNRGQGQSQQGIGQQSLGGPGFGPPPGGAGGGR